MLFKDCERTDRRPFGLGVEGKIRFSKWLPWWPSWISDWNGFYKSPRCFLPSFKSIGILVQEKKRKIDFQDGPDGRHLGFLIGMIF